MRGRESLAARQGFEPQYAAPEAAVLPLNERAVMRMLRVISRIDRLMVCAVREVLTCQS